MIGFVLVCTWTVLFLLGWFGFGWYLDGLILVYTWLGGFWFVHGWFVLGWFWFGLHLDGSVLYLDGFGL